MELKTKTLNINDVPGQKHVKLQDSNFIKNNEQYNVILANILTGIWQNDSKLNIKDDCRFTECLPRLHKAPASVPSTE